MDFYADTRLVVVDTLKAIRDVSSRNGAAYKIEHDVLKPFSDFYEFQDRRILLIHHTNKST